MGANHGADGIDLQQAGAREHAGEVAAVGRATWTGIEKPLRCECDAPGRRE
jgi:hypothetical protein